jgi:hypothetical protein
LNTKPQYKYIGYCRGFKLRPVATYRKTIIWKSDLAIED